MSQRPKVFIAADHGGRKLLLYLLKKLTADYEVAALSTTPRAGDDYPLVAHSLVQRVIKHRGTLGIAICRTGAGMSIVANKHAGIRAIQAWQPKIAIRGRQDEDANVLCLAADYLTPSQAVTIAQAFISNSFRPLKRYRRRLREIAKYDRQVSN